MQFVLNYEEGSENSVVHGDSGSEQVLSEMASPPAYAARYPSMEGVYEYGSRVGVWRILREFEKRVLPLTIFGVGMALQRYPEVAGAFVELDHEIACRGWRWIDYQQVHETTEREHMRLAIEAVQRAAGSRALGSYSGRDSPEYPSPNRRPRWLSKNEITGSG